MYGHRADPAITQEIQKATIEAETLAALAADEERLRADLVPGSAGRAEAETRHEQYRARADELRRRITELQDAQVQIDTRDAARWGPLMVLVFGFGIYAGVNILRGAGLGGESQGSAVLTGWGRVVIGGVVLAVSLYFGVRRALYTVAAIRSLRQNSRSLRQTKQDRG